MILEALRALAAIWVVLIHCAPEGRENAGLWIIVDRTAAFPVMAFFLLSGFVIALGHFRRDEKFGSYIRRRFVRVFPIYILALLATAAFPPDHALATGREFAANVLMLQARAWTNGRGYFEAFGGNRPLWSLSFEWWYYVAFWVLKTKVPKQATAIAFTAALLGAAIALKTHEVIGMWLALGGVWWCGAEIAREYSASVAITFARQWRSVAVLGLITGFALLQWRMEGHPASALSKGLWSSTSAALIVLIGWIAGQRLLRARFGRLEGLALALGGASYALYATHILIVEPVLSRMSHRTLAAAVALVASLIVALGIERYVQPAGVALVDRLWPRTD